MPSIRFLLTLHELIHRHVKQIDAFSHVYLKRWAGLPPSATNLVLHMKQGLDISSIETLYNTCHTLKHTAIRLKGDLTVNAALDNSILRESQWTQKWSTIVACESVHNFAINLHFPQEQMFPMPDQSLHRENSKLSQVMKNKSKKEAVFWLIYRTKEAHRYTYKTRR